MTECCGSERKTMFCPICGTKLQQGQPLAELIAHCRSQQDSQNKRLNAMIRRSELPDATPYEGEMASDRIEKRRMAVAKWKTWADEIQRILDTTDTDG